MILGFDVDGQFVTRRDDERVVNRSVNYLELCFNFKDTETWDDLIKRVLFKGNGETYSKQLDNENKVVVPSEVLSGDSFVFTLYGITDDDPVVRVTCNLMKIIMVSSGFTGDSLVPGPGNRSVVDDVYARLDGLDVTVGEHSVALSNLGDDVNGLGDSVDSLEDTVSRHTGSISDLTGTVNDHSNMLSNHDRSISNLDNALDNVSDTVDGLELTVGGHTNSIEGLNEKDGQLTNNIIDIYNKINNTIEMTVEYTDGTTETFDVVVK